MATQDLKEFDAVRLCRARNRLHAIVRGMLAGSGLDIRQRRKGLVISNPRDPGKGRIHINYTTGEVSRQRSVWEYYGPLTGYAQAPEPEADPVADTQTILHALGAGPEVD